MKYCHFDCALLIHIDSIAFKTKMQFHKINKLLYTYWHVVLVARERIAAVPLANTRLKIWNISLGMPKYYPLSPKCPFLWKDLSPTYPGPYESTPQSTSIGSAVLQGWLSWPTDRQSANRPHYTCSNRHHVQPSTKKSIQFFTSFTTELLVRLTGLRPRIHCPRCLKSLCISTALRTVRNLQPKKYRPSPQWQQNDMPRPFRLLLVATLTSAFELQPGTSAGLWLGGQCPLAAWGKEKFENLTTKWCILKYIWICGQHSAVLYTCLPWLL